jgi:hypothetical protein
MPLFDVQYIPHPNPSGGTTSHSTRLPKTAAKSLVIPPAGEGKFNNFLLLLEQLRSYMKIKQQIFRKVSVFWAQ